MWLQKPSNISRNSKKKLYDILLIRRKQQQKFNKEKQITSERWFYYYKEENQIIYSKANKVAMLKSHLSIEKSILKLIYIK